MFTQNMGLIYFPFGQPLSVCNSYPQQRPRLPVPAPYVHGHGSFSHGNAACQAPLTGLPPLPPIPVSISTPPIRFPRHFLLTQLLCTQPSTATTAACTTAIITTASTSKSTLHPLVIHSSSTCCSFAPVVRTVDSPATSASGTMKQVIQQTMQRMIQQQPTLRAERRGPGERLGLRGETRVLPRQHKQPLHPALRLEGAHG